MNRKYLLCCVAWLSFAFLLLSTAHTSDEILTLQRSSSGSIEAVVSGLDDGSGCVPEFVAPTSVEVDGAVVTISSPYTPEVCFLPLHSQLPAQGTGGPVPHRQCRQRGCESARPYPAATGRAELRQRSGATEPARLRFSFIARIQADSL